ncbi:MAG: J domain-containing protein [Alphaproteobacteria bacterium]
MVQFRVPPHSTDQGSAGGHGRPCEHPGCTNAGLHRAPRARDDLRNYYWFCLDHVRAYNRSWNFYAGMSEQEVESSVREDVVGWRPTWPIGMAARFGRAAAKRFRDPFGFFADAAADEESRPRHGSAGASGASPGKAPESQAFALFELRPPVSLANLKARYKELVKRHHPDANGGDKAAEEKLKLINHAYGLLKRLCG